VVSSRTCNTSSVQSNLRPNAVQSSQGQSSPAQPSPIAQTSTSINLSPQARSTTSKRACTRRELKAIRVSFQSSIINAHNFNQGRPLPGLDACSNQRTSLKNEPEKESEKVSGKCLVYEAGENSSCGRGQTRALQTSQENALHPETPSLMSRARMIWPSYSKGGRYHEDVGLWVESGAADLSRM
jgi:hypothetical protein